MRYGKTRRQSYRTSKAKSGRYTCLMCGYSIERNATVEHLLHDCKRLQARDRERAERHARGPA